MTAGIPEVSSPFLATGLTSCLLVFPTAHTHHSPRSKRGGDFRALTDGPTGNKQSFSGTKSQSQQNHHHHRHHDNMTSVDETGRKYTATKKAYKNEGFINSSQARCSLMCSLYSSSIVVASTPDVVCCGAQPKGLQPTQRDQYYDRVPLCAVFIL